MTKSLRGAANIKKFNDEREQQALALIKSELAKCKKHKMVFRSLGALAEYLGAITNIHRTTLMRAWLSPATARRERTYLLATPCWAHCLLHWAP